MILTKEVWCGNMSKAIMPTGEWYAGRREDSRDGSDNGEGHRI